MDNDEIREKLEELIEEAENNIRELQEAERTIKEIGIDRFSESIRDEFEEVLSKAKQIRAYYVSRLGSLDRAKKKLEEFE